MVTSDDCGRYAREVPKEKHLTGKIFTQRIERNNLPLRTRIKRLARKTISFSRPAEIHKKVIDSFIEKHMFYWLEALHISSNYDSSDGKSIITLRIFPVMMVLSIHAKPKRPHYSAIKWWFFGCKWLCCQCTSLQSSIYSSLCCLVMRDLIIQRRNNLIYLTKTKQPSKRQATALALQLPEHYLHRINKSSTGHNKLKPVSIFYYLIYPLCRQEKHLTETDNFLPTSILIFEIYGNNSYNGMLRYPVEGNTDGCCTNSTVLKFAS